MEAAWRRRLVDARRRGRGRSHAADGSGRRGPFAAWGGRRVGVALAFALIAGLTIGSSAFAASRAGGPLYDTRLALEELTLPTDPTARLEAELARAQSRVADIVDAASRGDDGAVEAAARAYGSIADRPRQRARLAGRIARSPPCGSTRRCCATSSPGCRPRRRAVSQQALARSTVAIDHLDSASGGEPAAQPGDAGQPANPPNAGGGNGNAGGNGERRWQRQRRRRAATATPAPRRRRTATATPAGTATARGRHPGTARQRTGERQRERPEPGGAKPERRQARSRRTSRTRASRRRRRRRPPTDGRVAPCAEPRQRAVRAGYAPPMIGATACG